jgi:Secretion system C-terminal sorting domain/Beta-propeller repeat
MKYLSQKIIIISTICSLLFLNHAQAQTEELKWVKTFGGTESDKATSVALDELGNVYTTGTFEGTLDFDPGVGEFNLSSVGYYDAFISKMDANGNFIWAKSMQSTYTQQPKSIELDGSGNIYLIGIYKDSLDLDPDINTFWISSVGVNYEDIFISKLDNSGNFIWGKSIQGISREIAESVAIDTDGNVYTTGTFWWIADFDPGPNTYEMTPGDGYGIFISKLDSDGNFVWAKSMGGTGAINIDSGHSLKLDSLGNVYTTDLFSGTIDFNPSENTFNLSSVTEDYTDCYISKLDKDGNFIWAKSFGSPFYDYGYELVLDDSANIYLSGNYSGILDADPGVEVYNLEEGFAVYISKLDSDGNFIWAKSIGGGYFTAVNSMTIDDNKNLYITGYFSDEVDFDPGPETYFLSATVNYDLFILKLDFNGNFIWAKNIGGSFRPEALDIAVDNFSNVYSVGIFDETVDFDPDEPIYNLTSVTEDYTDMFIHKYGPSTTNDLLNYYSEVVVSIYPNPADNKLNIRIKNEKQAIEYSIVNSFGQMVLNGKFIDEINTVDISRFAKGLYLLKVEKNKNQIFKFMKN